jgi:hypothetical protein
LLIGAPKRIYLLTRQSKQFFPLSSFVLPENTVRHYRCSWGSMKKFARTKILRSARFCKGGHWRIWRVTAYGMRTREILG